MARALAWIVDYVAEFDPFKGGRAFEVAFGQRVTELATMLNSYVAVTGDRDSAEVRALVAEARAQQQNHRLTDRIMHSPAEFVLFADLYAALKRLGHDDGEQRELIQRVIDAGFLDQIERVPHRMMDVRLTLEWGELRHSWKSLEELSESSILPHEPSALHLDESSLYSLTHVIMFLYGFGTRIDAASPLTAEQQARFHRTLSMLLVITAQQHHWDLLCELLLCWDCMGFDATHVYDKAWDAFLEMQGQDGGFPGPERALASNDWDGADDPIRKRELYFAHHYHTTLVAVIALGVHTRRRDRLAGARRPAADHVPALQSGGASKARITALRRAERWLLAQWDVHCSEATPEQDARRESACLEILVGVHICAEILRDHRHVEELSHQLSRDSDGGSRQWFTSHSPPPKLAMIAAGILHRQQCVSRPLDAAVARIADVLARNQITDPVADLEWSEARVLLHAMGLHPEPASLSHDSLFSFANAMSLGSAFPLVEQLAMRADSFTAYGTRGVSLAAADWWLPEMLLGFASLRFRAYELRRATRLLRSVSALTGADHPMLSECRDYLMLHQEREGALGFFGPAEAEVMRNAAPGFSFDRDVRVPVTLDCVWALAECGGEHWRLFQSVGG